MNTHNFKFTVLLFLCSTFPFISFGQQNIPNQDVFNQIIDAGGFQWDENQVEGEPDYTFIPGQGQPQLYIITADRQLAIDDGTIIHIAPNVVIRVEGSMEIFDDQGNGGGFAQTIICGLNENDPNQMPWDAIEVWGDGFQGGAGIENGVGEVQLTNCLISGGGAGMGWFVGVPDWSGLIRLMSPQEVEDGVPELHLTDCTLQRSQNNGIVVSSENDILGAFIRINGLTMTGDFEDPFDFRIQGCGLKFGDINLNDINNDKLENDFDIVDADVANCGLHGVFAWLSGGTNIFRKSEEEEDSFYRLNGWRDDDFRIPQIPPLEDVIYYPQEGCGIDYYCTGNFGYPNDADDILTISDVECDQNTWDGVRVQDNWMRTTIELCRIHDNDDNGIWFDYGGISKLSFIESNDIWHNGSDGIYVSKGAGGYAAIMIRGNHVHDNNQDAAGGQISEIRVKGHIGRHEIDLGDGQDNGIVTEIRNNIVHDNHNHGLSIIWLMVQEVMQFPGEFVAENNIIYDCQQNGIWLQYQIVGQQNSPVLRNNTLFSLGGNGILIDWPCTPRGDAWWLENNIFSNCIVGINDDSQDGQPQLPEFIHNGFWENQNNTDGCAAPQNPPGINVFADPRFVNTVDGQEDFHLQWDSPMINMGNAGAFFDLDGSVNDIGGFGGPGAGNFERVGFEDYCAILPEAQLSDNGEAFGLEYDTFWMFGNASITPNQTLTVEAGATVVMFPDVKFVTNGTGTLVIDGTGWGIGERVLFRARDELNEEQYIQDNPHAGIRITGGQGHSIEFLDVWGAGGLGYSYAIEINSGAVVNTWENNRCHHSYGGLLVSGECTVNIDDSDFDFNHYYGIRLSNTGQVVGIHRCHVNDNYERGIRASYGVREIVDTDVLRNGWQQVWLSYCDIDPEIDMIRGAHSNFSDPGERNLASYGFYLLETDAVFDQGNRPEFNGRCRIVSNKSYGLCTSSGSEPTIRNTDFIENGWPDIGLRPEIQVATGHTIDFDPFEEDPGDNWIEDERGFNHRVLIRRATMVGGQIDGTWSNWWITGADAYEVCLPTSENDPDARLLTEETILNWVHTDDFDEDRLPWIALREAKGLAREGAYREAIQAFTEIIAEYPQSPAARIALSGLSGTWIKAGRSIETLNRYIGSLEIPDDVVMLRDDIFYKHLFNLVRMREYDQAINGLRARVENARDLLDSLRAAVAVEEAILVRMFEERDGDLDASMTITEQEKRLSDVVEALIAAESLPTIGGNQNAPPMEFEILQAYPNPFNGEVSVIYGLPKEGEVSVRIFDTNGREMAVLFEGLLAAGYHRQTWSAKDFPSGTYLCRIKSTGQEKVVKLNLVK